MQHRPDSKCATRGANVQSVELRTVVTCDRCPSETTDGSDAHRYKWSTVAIGTGLAGRVRMLTLCVGCSRTFRLFMLGAAIGASVEESWERILDESGRAVAINPCGAV